MIRKTTWILLAVFVALLGALLVYQEVTDPEFSVTTDLGVDLGTLELAAPLFPVQDGEVVLGLSVEDNQGNFLAINRGNENDDWVFLDLEGQANQEAINRVISQISNISIDRRLDSGLDMELTWLVDPAYLIQLAVSNGGVFTVHVGEVTITG